MPTSAVRRESRRGAGVDPAALRPALDRLYRTFTALPVDDPVHVARRYARDDDREVVAFVAAALAFGRVAGVIRSTSRLLALMGEAPARYVRAFDPGRELGRFALMGHRWIRPADLAALLWILRAMLERSGSIEGFFLEGDDREAPDVSGGLESFSARALEAAAHPALRGAHAPGRVAFFFPRPRSGSGCKRLNLFLRWMVRRDAIDFGLWTRVSPARLVVPLDTHVIRVGRCLGLTRYASPGWAMAAEITSRLRLLDPDDPVKYDFSLCHLGMLEACGFNRPQRDSRCPLRGFCRPGRRTRPASRSPSARR
jgi:uncharacterized protein (TIGR02757 family)